MQAGNEIHPVWDHLRFRTAWFPGFEVREDFGYRKKMQVQNENTDRK